MLKTLSIFSRLCVFKAEPKDVPYSVNLMLSLVALRVVVNFLTVDRQDLPAELTDVSIAAISIAGICISGGFIYLLLKAKKVPNRFVQTFSAFLGVDLIFKLAAYFFYSNPLTQGAFMQLVWIIYIWDIAVVSYILARGMEIAVGYALLLILGFNIMFAAVVQSIVLQSAQ